MKSFGGDLMSRRLTRRSKTKAKEVIYNVIHSRGRRGEEEPGEWKSSN